MWFDTGHGRNLPYRLAIVYPDGNRTQKVQEDFVVAPGVTFVEGGVAFRATERSSAW